MVTFLSHFSHFVSLWAMIWIDPFLHLNSLFSVFVQGRPVSYMMMVLLTLVTWTWFYFCSIQERKPFQIAWLTWPAKVTMAEERKDHPPPSETQTLSIENPSKMKSNSQQHCLTDLLEFTELWQRFKLFTSTLWLSRLRCCHSGVLLDRLCNGYIRW